VCIDAKDEEVVVILVDPLHDPGDLFFGAAMDETLIAEGGYGVSS
jgi:hypothetical protein